MTEAFTVDLAALRQAAQNRDHAQGQFLLKRLFGQFPFYHALVIPIERAHGYVDTFERYHPEAVWARQVLIHIATVGTTPGNLPDEAMREYPTPGSANFVKAVFDLGNAAYQEHPLEARASPNEFSGARVVPVVLEAGPGEPQPGERFLTGLELRVR